MQVVMTRGLANAHFFFFLFFFVLHLKWNVSRPNGIVFLSGTEWVIPSPGSALSPPTFSSARRARGSSSGGAGAPAAAPSPVGLQRAFPAPVPSPFAASNKQGVKHFQSIRNPYQTSRKRNEMHHAISPLIRTGKKMRKEKKRTKRQSV